MWEQLVLTVVGGAAVSWPAVFLGFWLSHKKMDRVTDSQTEELVKLSEDQTKEILRARTVTSPVHRKGS